MKHIKHLIIIAMQPILLVWRRLLAFLGGEAGKRRRRANQLARQMVSELSRLGFTKKVVDGAGKRRRTQRQRVTFEEPLLLTADELWCPLNLSKLPFGVKTDDLRDESVLRSLMDRTDCSVRIDYLANGKLCYVIRHGGAQFPEILSINKVELSPDLPALCIPAGVNADGDQQFIDLDECVHLLVAGATGNGKTVFQHVALTTLINRNTADDLELWLIDLKQTEFNLYRPLCKKKGDGMVKAIAVEPEDAVDLLDRALKEINRRNQMMVQHNATSLDDLKQMGVRLHKICIFIDEFAQLTLNTTKLGKQSIGKIAENYLTRIAALGRSAGVRIVVSTQMVNSAVVSSLIRANFENRVAFSTADWRQSQLIVESSEADGLPRGRAILKIRGQTSMVQTAYITSRQVKIEVERVAQFGPDGAWGEELEKQRFVKDAKLLVDMACRNYDGNMHRNKILALEEVKGVVGFDRFLEVTQKLERDGVLEPAHSNRPRRVNRVFFNRLALIDNLYGTTDSTTPTDIQALLATAEPVEALSNEQGSNETDTETVVCSVHETPLVQSVPIAQSVEQPKPVIKPLKRKPSNQTPAHL